MCVLVARLCLTLCDPMDPTRFFCPWYFSGKKTRVGCHFLLQGIFLTQGSNSGFLPWRRILYLLSHQGRPLKHLRGLQNIVGLVGEILQWGRLVRYLATQIRNTRSGQWLRRQINVITNISFPFPHPWAKFSLIKVLFSKFSWNPFINKTSLMNAFTFIFLDILKIQTFHPPQG